jgi:hypothetical protein
MSDSPAVAWEEVERLVQAERYEEARTAYMQFIERYPKQVGDAYKAILPPNCGPLNRGLGHGQKYASRTRNSKANVQSVLGRPVTSSHTQRNEVAEQEAGPPLHLCLEHEHAPR